MSNVIDMTAAVRERREQELRDKHGIKPDQTLFRLDYLVERVLIDCRLKMLERTNGEAASR